MQIIRPPWQVTDIGDAWKFVRNAGLPRNRTRIHRYYFLPFRVHNETVNSDVVYLLFIIFVRSLG